MPASSKVTLHQFYICCLERNLPVAFYRLPETDEIKIIGQKNSTLHQTTFSEKSIHQKGFLFSPFIEDKRFRKIIIHPDIFCNENKLPKLNFSKQAIIVSKQAKQKLKATDKKHFESLVRKIKSKIKQNDWKKVVAAGVIKKDKPKNFDTINFFQSLCKAYPHAFISLVFTPEYGLWIGATPEILLSVDKKNFASYSLAGTKANSKIAWGNKEKEEQKLVSDYISSVLSKTTKVKPEIRGPETVTAGNLFHLRTTFTANSVSFSLWQKIAEALHPTPAVAGLPKSEAIEFINKNEAAPRGFYSGYLGPVNLDGQINLYVNIRCMQVLKNKLAVHVGCGITAGSKPSGEWREAKNKSQTLLGVLRQKA